MAARELAPEQDARSDSSFEPDAKSHRYFAIHKPYGMLSQFVGGHPGLAMLGELDFSFPEGIHAVGRLDYESEGLLLLTTNKAVTRLLFDPTAAHARSYLVNVCRYVSEYTISKLAKGVTIRIRDGLEYVTEPAIVERIERPSWLPRAPHELREDIAQDWLRMTLTQGKYRQVRKMLKAVSHSCRRLVRVNIAGMTLGDLKSGEVREVNKATFFGELRLAG